MIGLLRARESAERELGRSDIDHPVAQRVKDLSVADALLTALKEGVRSDAALGLAQDSLARLNTELTAEEKLVLSPKARAKLEADEQEIKQKLQNIS